MTFLICQWWRRLMMRFRSPILSFDNQIAASPSKLAPERAEELRGICERHNLQIVIVDESQFGIRVSLETHEIKLPIAAMEYVWTQALRFWVIAQEYKEAQHAGKLSLDVHGNKRLVDVARAVEWSGNNIQTTGKNPWPSDLPKPRRKPKDEDRQVANELFLGAMGWIILHEIGHVELGHAELAGTYSQVQEKEADIFATKWVLDKVEDSDPRFNKRIFCVAVALLCLQSFETVAAPRWRDDHPPANERISHCLDRYRGAATERVTAFLVVCLQVLFADTDVSPDISGQSFEDILDELFINISRWNA